MAMIRISGSGAMVSGPWAQLMERFRENKYIRQARQQKR